MSRRGFSLVELMVAVGVIGLLVAIAVPAYARVRAKSQCETCLFNLRQIDAAKEQWAIEKRKRAGTTVRQVDILPYLQGGKMPTCPARGRYAVRALGQAPSCTLARRGHALTNINLDEDPAPD